MKINGKNYSITYKVILSGKQAFYVKEYKNQEVAKNTIETLGDYSLICIDCEKVIK